MRFVYFFIVALSILVSGCGGYLTELAKKGEVAFLAGNYDSALVVLEEAIFIREDAGKLAKGKIYANAGKTAFALDDANKAIGYFEKAVKRNYVDEEMYAVFAKSYRKIDNLSKEINILESYVEKFPLGAQINEMKSRLFGTYVESENFDKAQNLWPDLEKLADSDLTLMGNYLWLNEGMDKKDICEKIAKEIIIKDSKNPAALEWYGKKYYDKAEDRYQAEMDKYNKKKTRSNYNKLVKALKTVTADFKKAKNYYLSLYKINPDPEFAQYLSNIYARLSNKEKAKYYRKKSY